jgi:hypothetical protein
VKSHVLALVFIDVHGNFFDQAKLLAVGSLEALEICGQDVVGFSGGEALFEFPVVVGEHLPPNFAGLVFSAANFYGNAIHRAIVRAPYGSDDYGIRLAFGFLG